MIITTILIWLLTQCVTAYFFFNLQPKAYLKRCFISLDQTFNTIFCFGYEDETLSSRAFRLARNAKDKAKDNIKDNTKNNAKAKWYHKAPEKIIDFIFFWDKKTVTYTDAYPYDENPPKVIHYKHCELSYQYEKERMHSPPEMRRKVRQRKVKREKVDKVK